MGISISANVAVGVLVYESDGDLNTEFELPEDCDDIAEYLGVMFDDCEGISVNIAGAANYPSWVVTLDKYTFSVDWSARVLPENDLNNLDLGSELKTITDKLENAGLEYGDCGILLYPYFSR